MLGLEKINHHQNKSNSRSNIQKCCWVPFELWNKRIIPSQRVRIIARSEIYFLKIWGKSLPLSDPTRGWCSIFCNSWVQISHISGISSSPFHACRWLNYSTLIPSSKETQASVVCIKSWWDFISWYLCFIYCILFPMEYVRNKMTPIFFRNGWMGDGSYWHRNEAQTRRWSIRRCLWGHMETI